VNVMEKAEEIEQFYQSIDSVILVCYDLGIMPTEVVLFCRQYMPTEYSAQPLRQRNYNLEISEIDLNDDYRKVKDALLYFLKSGLVSDEKDKKRFYELMDKLTTYLEIQ